MIDSVQSVRKLMKVLVPLFVFKKLNVRSLISALFASVVHDILINYLEQTHMIDNLNKIKLFS